MKAQMCDAAVEELSEGPENSASPDKGGFQSPRGGVHLQQRTLLVFLSLLACNLLSAIYFTSGSSAPALVRLESRLDIVLPLDSAEIMGSCMTAWSCAAAACIVLRLLAELPVGESARGRFIHGLDDYRSKGEQESRQTSQPSLILLWQKLLSLDGVASASAWALSTPKPNKLTVHWERVHGSSRAAIATLYILCDQSPCLTKSYWSAAERTNSEYAIAAGPVPARSHSTDIEALAVAHGAGDALPCLHTLLSQKLHSKA